MIRIVSSFVLCLSLVAVASAEDEYSVVALDEAPADVSPEIAAAVSSKGFKVMKGENRTVCSFWPAKTVETKADFTPTAALIYPVEMGTLVGVINYKRGGEDFRGQTIEAGTYTVRFALQPEDGNHIGTSDTRDFFLLLKPSEDASPALVPKEDLFKKSAAAAGTTHPCMLSLLSAEGATGTPPSIEHIADRDLWNVAFALPKAKGDGTLPIRLVVVGKAAE